jgi:hypothetical protein
MPYKIPGEHRPQHLTTEMHTLRSLTGTQSSKTDILYNNSDEALDLSLSLSHTHIYTHTQMETVRVVQDPLYIFYTNNPVTTQ